MPRPAPSGRSSRSSSRSWASRAAPPSRSRARLRPVDTSLPTVPTPGRDPHRRPAAARAHPAAVAHGVGRRSAVGVRGRLRTVLLPRGRLAAPPPRRSVAAAPHRAVGRRPAAAALGHLRAGQRLPGLPLQHPHDRAHAAVDGDPAVPRASVRRSRSPPGRSTSATTAPAAAASGSSGPCTRPFARVVTHPLVAAAIFIGSLWAFYYTELFRWSLYDHLGHEWMVAHFLISGYLFVQSLIGIDPVPYRLPYPFRLVTLIGDHGDARLLRHRDHDATGLFVAEWFGVDGAHVGRPAARWTSTPAAASRGRSARSRP